MGLHEWQRISLILCTFGLLKELRPSEPYITEYILDFKNITSHELIHVAFPVSTYTSLAALAILFFVTDFLRHQPIVIFEAISYVLTWLILIIGEDLNAIIFVEIFYGIACSTEIAYYTYIYAKVDKSHYQKVTSYTSSALLVGKFLGGLLAQISVTYKLMNYHSLTYVTLACSCLGLIATLFLPGVKSSVYFHPSSTSIRSQEKNRGFECSALRKKLNFMHKRLWKDWKLAYSNPYILKWSIWWALASAGQYQVVNYIQALWEKVNEESGLNDVSYNGAVKSIHTLLSAIMSFSVGHLRLKWTKWGESCLSIVSCVQGLMLLWMAQTMSMHIAYFSYIVFRTIHPVVLTIASAEVAQGISQDSYGLIFGMNTFLALVMQTTLTLIFSDEKGLALDERTQFFSYGIYFLVLGSLFFVTFVSSKLFSCAKKSIGEFEGCNDQEESQKHLHKARQDTGTSANNTGGVEPESEHLRETRETT